MEVNKFILLAVFICTSFCLCAQDLTKSANLERYESDNLSLSVVSDVVPPVFIGGSITEGWIKQRPEFFLDNDYVGRGISGQTAPQLLLRFRRDVLQVSTKIVVINVGLNDIAENTGSYSEDLTIDCIKNMADLAAHQSIEVILSSVTPCSAFPWRKDIEDVSEKIDALNVKIKEYAASREFPYIDYNSKMQNEEGGMKDEFSDDGVHPNSKGYDLMQVVAKKAIDETLNGLETNGVKGFMVF